MKYVYNEPSRPFQSYPHLRDVAAGALYRGEGEYGGT